MLSGRIITCVVSRIKADFGGVFERSNLTALCEASGCRWRERLLSPARSIELLLIQVLHGNTAINHLRHLVGFSFTASAYCQARGRLPVEALKRLLKLLSKRFITKEDGTWHGHRTFLVDGTSFSMPDTPKLRDYFGYAPGQKKECGFPLGHLLGLFHASSGLIQEIVPAPGAPHDISQVALVHPALKKGDILVGDRAFCSFVHVALLLQRGLQGVFRMHQRLKISKTHALRRIKKLAKNDQIVEWQKSPCAPSWINHEKFQALPDSVVVRVLFYQVTKPGFRTHRVSVITTLLDPNKYSLLEIAKLYQSRWEIETNFRYLKTTLGMDILHCKSVSGVLKEIYAFAIVYNLVRIAMLHEALSQGIPINRVSFIDTLRALSSGGSYRFILLIVNPLRPNRKHPRAVKRRPKQFPLLNKPRHRFVDRQKIA